MRTSKFSEEQIIGFLRQAEAGMSIKGISLLHESSRRTHLQSDFGSAVTNIAHDVPQAEVINLKDQVITVDSKKTGMDYSALFTSFEQSYGTLNHVGHSEAFYAKKSLTMSFDSY